MSRKIFTTHVSSARKITAAKNPITLDGPIIDGAIAISDIYPVLLQQMNRLAKSGEEIPELNIVNADEKSEKGCKFKRNRQNRPKNCNLFSKNLPKGCKFKNRPPAERFLHR